MDSKQKELKSRLEDLKKYQQEQESILQVSQYEKPMLVA
jgi:hypothetical protein